MDDVLFVRLDEVDAICDEIKKGKSTHDRFYMQILTL